MAAAVSWFSLRLRSRKIRQVLAREQLHDEERIAVVRLPDVLHLDDVLVPDLARGLRLADEPWPELRIGPDQELQRHVAVRLYVTRGPDDAHGTLSKAAEESIPACDQGASHERG
ncbi:MAG: hypothetical protein QM820_55815 [Minicystis sp.]